MRVLVIDGDAATTGSTAAEILQSEGCSVEFTDMGEEGVELAKLYDFDLITLDLTLPDMTGFEALRQIRRAGVKTPVLILSAMAKVEDIVKALGLGADDYLTKPFHNEELVARVGSLVRRSKGHAQSLITTGNLELNLTSKTARVAGAPVHLTGKEYQMLELLSLRKGMTLSKEAFLTHLYGGRDEPEIKIVDVFICKLRKKLTAAGSHPIETVWGRGYVLRDADSKSGSAADVADFIGEPPVHVSKMSFAEYDALKDKLKEPGIRGRVRGGISTASKARVPA